MLDHALDILETLVAFDTTSSKSNRALIDWVATRLAERNIPYWLVEDADGGKANLLARIGPDVPGGIVLSGHSDVVPVDGQPWTSDPWTVTRRDDRLYGRGVADMKGFIALVLALIDTPAVQSLQRPLILAITYDEEVGCLGAPHLLDRMAAFVPAPALAIIGEPTSMKVLSVHKGMRVFDVTVTGREAHSSQRDQGVSAIAAAVELMSLIGEMNAQAQDAIRADDPCSPPGTTLSVGIVNGGTAANILARQCTFRWDLRSPNEAEADGYEARFRAAAQALDARIRARAPEGGVVITPLASAPPLELDRDSAAESFVRSLTGDNGLSGAAFVAEAGLYQKIGIPAVLCGPGSILQAHQPDEWIEIDQLRAGADFLMRLADRLSSETNG
ncbi:MULTISPECIES: acetylornithine deacetylase [unclassified Sphingobium]|uniref:acetylornithine deacetylase n=1 Tax=unclassified Sphingobium TaxID=2611147 RepID=UPI0022253EB5|nr:MULTISPECIES: acetylornithine deacetylase [unclassified Sphingobium]MCW2380914.1 acetylornithine deacetylase [Sphingobium sp. B2D3B]MCW2398980.1 acetylornithine deacetylase [Sphingobium sp. B2D3C]